MKTKLVVLSVILFMAFTLTAGEKIEFKNGQSAMFFKDGGLWVKKIVDMSSRTKKLEFLDDTKINIQKVWMINFLNRTWNYPSERGKLSKKMDTIFLKDGTVYFGKIIDFSSRRRVFELKKDSAIHVSKIKRIYFCCTNIPEKFKEKLKTLKTSKYKKEQPKGVKYKKIKKKQISK